MLEFKHVSLYEGASDLLVGPCDEQLVVVVSLTYGSELNNVREGEGRLAHFFCKSSRKVDRILQVHSVPIIHLYANLMLVCVTTVKNLARFLTRMSPEGYRVLGLFQEQTLVLMPTRKDDDGVYLIAQNLYMQISYFSIPLHAFMNLF